MKFTRPVMVLVLLCGCITPYGPRRAFSGGYEESPLQYEGQWYLEVSGNSFTSRATLLSYWYRRAGELCGGSQYEARLDVERKDVDLGTVSNTTASVQRTWGGLSGSSRTTTHQLGSVSKYSVMGVLICATTTPDAGCRDDTECKGARICEQGRCRDP